MAMFVIVLFAFTFLGVITYGQTGPDTSVLDVGLPMIFAGVASLVGSVFALKSLREPGSGRKYIGIIINFFFSLLLLAIVVANVLDLVWTLRG
jgi:hypothetical protein